MVNGTIELDRPVIESAVICRLSPSCVKDVAEIEAESNTPPWTEQLFSYEFNNRCSRVYGARVAGRIVGFLVCHVIEDEAHIMNFGLRRDERGRGYGRELIQYVLRDLHEDSVHWVTLEVRKGNAVARRLYDSLGFLEVGLRERYYRDNQEDALVLKLNLQQFINQFGSDSAAT
ncbi:MAG: ribosomal protein S18-alanine N-acetyltransferase [Deltaproteobacteria bacterium]|nr:ribosomal protein S18-alanine N-acetyltransferase [Deltaproteobacteria bacterium]